MSVYFEGSQSTAWPYPEDKAVTLHISNQKLKVGVELENESPYLPPFTLIYRVILYKSHYIYEPFSFFRYKNRRGNVSDSLLGSPPHGQDFYTIKSRGNRVMG